MTTKTTTTKAETSAEVVKVLFDAAGHRALVAERRVALTAAEDQLAAAKANATTAAEHLEDVEAELGTGEASGSDLLLAEADDRAAQEVLKRAEINRRGAERAVPNDDTELAEAVAGNLRHLIPDFLGIAVAPGAVDGPTTLPHHLPIVVVEQVEGCVRSPRGWMSTPKNGKPIRLRIFSDPALDLLGLDAESIFAAVRLDATRPEMIRERTSIYAAADGSTIRERTFDLRVAGAVSAVPLVTEPDNAQSVGLSVLVAVKRAFRSNLRHVIDPVIDVEVHSAEELPGTIEQEGGLVARKFSVTFTLTTDQGDPSTTAVRLTRAIGNMTGHFLDGVGTVTESGMSSAGHPVHGLGTTGFSKVETTLTVVSRTR